MSVFRPKLWTSLSAAAVLTAAGGLAACGSDGESGETAATTPAAPTAVASVGGEGGGGEGEGGEAAGATGEAGANDAYTAVAAESRPALHLAHLKGFVLAAQAIASTEGPEAASALVGQGMLEVYEPSASQFKTLGVNETALRNAARTGSTADLSAALVTLNQAAQKAGGDPAQVVKGMTNIASGLYAEVLKDGAVDTVEYQHAYGAALSARNTAAQGGLTGVVGELDRFVGLWPSPTAPEDVAKVTPVGQVLAQASRIELAL
jgi:hypothetical protein